MEHLGVVIPTSAFVNATFDLKQLAALAATSSAWNKFATAKADEILIAEIAARVPFVSRDGLVTFKQNYNITGTPHIKTLNFSLRKLVHLLDATEHLNTRKKHQRYPKDFATVLSPDLFVYIENANSGTMHNRASFLAQLHFDGNNALANVFIYIAIMIHISLCPLYFNSVGVTEKLAANLRVMNSGSKIILKSESCHPIIKSTYSKYYKLIKSLLPPCVAL